MHPCPVPDSGPVSRALVQIPADVRDDRMLAELVCRACVAGLDVDGAAISLHTASTLRETLHATDATADLLEDLQFTLGEGACMEAAVTGRPVLTPDFDDPAEVARWPVYADAIVEQAGVRAIFAFPLQWGTLNLGVLDLYRRVPGSMPKAQLRDATSAADTAALMLLDLCTAAPADLDADDRAWDRSWGRRAEIHQATGMVVAQLGIGATDAFARLRAYAFADGRLLGEVARDVVTRRLRLPDEPSEDRPQRQPPGKDRT